MRNLLALVGAAVILVAVVGWYRNWYSVETTPSSGGHQSVNIDIDRSRISDDIHRGEERIQDALERTRREADKQGQSNKKESGKPDSKIW